MPNNFAFAVESTELNSIFDVWIPAVGGILSQG